MACFVAENGDGVPVDQLLLDLDVGGVPLGHRGRLGELGVGAFE